MQLRSREPYKWWIRKICRSKGTTGISNPVASQGITATSTATGIGQDEEPIPSSSSDHTLDCNHQIPFKTSFLSSLFFI
jgi:hypothetical protein